MSALEAMRDRRSWSKVTDLAPTGPELEAFVAAAGRVADHKTLRPWRIIEIRGSDRDLLARALNKADGKKGYSSKPRRAPLVIAIVADVSSKKIPAWEQEATASGVAHMLSLVLDEAGFGVFWRTDDNTRSKALAKAHGLRKGEVLLGGSTSGASRRARARSVGRRWMPRSTSRACPGARSAGSSTTRAPDHARCDAARGVLRAASVSEAAPPLSGRTHRMAR